MAAKVYTMAKNPGMQWWMKNNNLMVFLFTLCQFWQIQLQLVYWSVKVLAISLHVVRIYIHVGLLHILIIYHMCTSLWCTRWGFLKLDCVRRSSEGLWAFTRKSGVCQTIVLSLEMSWGMWFASSCIDLHPTPSRESPRVHLGSNHGHLHPNMGLT